MLTAAEALEKSQKARSENSDNFIPKSLNFMLETIAANAALGGGMISLYRQEIIGEVEDALKALGYEIIITGSCNLRVTCVIRWDPTRSIF